MNFPAELIKHLRARPRVAVLTGAGVSAESGVPTFRDAQTGLWAQLNPQELATPQAFQKNPKLVWDWYTYRRQLINQVKPNPGHNALAEMEALFQRFDLITQNIDGLHALAGSGSHAEASLIELHGNIHRAKCWEEGTIFETFEEGNTTPPHCPNCNGLLRPDVVWFGEALPVQALQQALQAAEECHVFFSIGTSGVVEPAASLPFIALRQGAVVIEINPNETPLTGVASYCFQGPSGEILPELLRVITLP